MKALTALFGTLMLLTCGSAKAVWIDYTFTVTAPFEHGSDLLGGSSNPVELRFRIDSNAPNISSPSTTNATYPINDFGVGGFGAVSFDGVVTHLEGGPISIQDSSSPGDGFTATTNGPDDGTRIEGRSLFMSYAHIFDFSGQMFNKLALPRNAHFSTYATFGMFRLVFRPNTDDPEFQTNDYVFYDVFPVQQGDFSLRVRVVPEPNSFALFGTLLLALVAFRTRRQAIKIS